MFLDNFTKRQYKAYKNGIIVGVYNSKEMAEKEVKSGYLDKYEEVPEQIQFNGKFYNKFGAPKEFYFSTIKFKIFEIFYRFIKPPMKFIVSSLRKIFIPFLLLSISFLLILLCIIGYKHIPSNKCWIDFVSAIAPAIIGIGSTITAIYSIIYTKKSITQQQEQWIKNEFIKREAQILINFREKFYDSQDSIFWFLNTFMQPYRCCNFIPSQEELTIKIEIFNNHYIKLKELNDLYNENQLIYRKHNIDKQMVYITTLLKSITFMNGEDMCAIFSQKTENNIEYIRPESIKFASSFVTGLDFEFAPKNKDIIKNLQKITQKDDIETRLKKYIEKANSDFINLMFKLDEITTYYNGDMPNNLKRRETYKCFTAEEYFKQRQAKQNN